MRIVVVTSCLLAACAGAPSEKRPTSTIAIDHMLIPAVAEAGGPVAAYAGFDNEGGADRLLGIECSCATSVELHRVVRDGDQVSMTNTFPLALPAGRRSSAASEPSSTRMRRAIASKAMPIDHAAHQISRADR